MSTDTAEYGCLEMWRLPQDLSWDRLEKNGEMTPDEANDVINKEFVIKHKGPFEDNALTSKADISLFEEIWVVLGLLIVLGGPLYWVGFGFYCFVFSGWGWDVCAGYIVVTLILAFHPLPMVVKSTWSSRFVKCLYKYFSYRFVFVGTAREEFRKHAPILGAGLPHGVMPFANLLSTPAVSGYLYTKFKGAPASVVFNTPFLRYFTLFGSCHVGRQDITKELLDGYSVGLVGDGIAGIFQCREEDEVICLKERKGLAKLALTLGVPLLPCYSIGNTEAFSSWYDPWGFMESISRKTQASLFFYWGRFFLPIPKRVNITLAVGDIIKVEKVENPTQEQIDQVHQRFLDGVETAFNRHKASVGWAHKKIRFV